MRPHGTELIEELAVPAVLEEAHDRDPGATLDLGMDGDAPADAGLGVIVEDDREWCGRHGEAGEGHRSQA